MESAQPDMAGAGVGGGSAAGAGAMTPSKAPMSAAAPSTRGNPAPRWSLISAARLLPASIAELPGARACVRVGQLDRT